MDDKIRTTAEAAEGDALPRLREVHVDPEAKCPEPLKAPSPRKSPAQWAYERMILYIQNFEKQLDNEHEVAMGFAGGDAGILRIEGMGYYDPDIVTLYGSDSSGGKTQLVQHVSQLSVLLRALPLEADHAEPTRIGFRLAKALEDDEQAG